MKVNLTLDEIRLLLDVINKTPIQGIQTMQGLLGVVSKLAEASQVEATPSNEDEEEV